jgi:alpha-methylacyl-CoA racemase
MRGRASAGLGENWSSPPGHNMLDGGAPFYGVYKCSDDKFISLAALEPHFYAEFLYACPLIIFRLSFLNVAFFNFFIRETLKNATTQTDLDSTTINSDTQMDRSTWPGLRTYFTKAFALKSRDEWAKIFSTGDSCVTPVLEISEVGPDGEGPLEVGDKKDWSEEGGIPEPAPFLTRTPARRASEWYAAPNETNAEAKKKRYFLTPGQHTREILQETGYEDAEIDKLLEGGAVTELA